MSQAPPEPVPPPRRRTRWGVIALLGVFAFYVPVYLSIWLPRLGVPLPGGVDYNISSLVFDFGFAFDLLILVMCVAGLSDRRDRKLAVVALVLLAAAFLGLVL